MQASASWRCCSGATYLPWWVGAQHRASHQTRCRSFLHIIMAAALPVASQDCSVPRAESHLARMECRS